MLSANSQAAEPLFLVCQTELLCSGKSCSPPLVRTETYRVDADKMLIHINENDKGKHANGKITLPLSALTAGLVQFKRGPGDSWTIDIDRLTGKWVMHTKNFGPEVLGSGTCSKAAAMF